MEKQAVEYLLSEYFTLDSGSLEHLPVKQIVSGASLESLAKGYILNCRSEGKSSKTIKIYETVIKNFIWYCRQNSFPETHRLTAVHIRHFLWYLASESGRWASKSHRTKKPAGQTTANDYYRALHSYFNWLEREELTEEPSHYIGEHRTIARALD